MQSYYAQLAKRINNEFSFENSFETLKTLPVSKINDMPINMPIQWIKMSGVRGKTIFPDKFKGINVNQGSTGLFFLFSCLSSIATIPSLIYRLFGNNDNWRNTKSFIIFLFYNNERKTISITDNFPFKDNDWIWSRPEKNELFCKLIEKAYLKYQFIYGKYNDFTSHQNFVSSVFDIIFKGGLERDAMKILINSETQTIFYSGYHNRNVNEMFQEIVKFKNKHALITLARNCNFKNNELPWDGHAYSVIDAWEKRKDTWEKRKGFIKKQVLCIKNPWGAGNNAQENFNYQFLKNSLKDFPEFLTFNEEYFNMKSSIFIAPLDFLLENGVFWIEAHIPNYEKDFPSVQEQLKLYNKLEKLFKKIQNDDVKNIYDSNIDKNKEITRVLSVGEENTREIISDINNKDSYLITKKGEHYCELRKNYNGNYSVTNLSEMFYKDYVDIGILTNNITGEKTYYNLDTILNSETKYYPNKSLTIFNQSIKPNSKMNELLYEIKPKTYTNFYISEYKTIYYSNGYYIGWVYNGQRHGEGEYHWNNGEYYIGDWSFNQKDGKGEYHWNNGNYYIGDWSDNERTGKGEFNWNNGDYYIGDWSSAQKDGKGEYHWNNGDYYIGDWSDNERTGNGEYHWNNGDYYKGVFIDGVITGHGKKYYNNGAYEDGIFRNGKFIEGKKRIIYSNGSYEGGWENGCENGYGVEIINGKTYKGNYINGKRHGKFRTISENGSNDSVEFEYGKEKSCIIF